MDYNIELILFERDVAAIIEVYLGGKGGGGRRRVDGLILKHF